MTAYSDVIQHIESLGMNTIQPGLERMQEACARLGHLERACPIIHVAGTNGKGSTLAFLRAILQSSVGSYISPHLSDIRERIMIGDQWISELDFIKAHSEVAALDLSYFEMLTLMAFVHFKRKPVDVLLLETGMGGRWDATNVCTPMVTILTPIAMDHQAYLGDTLEKIAEEKCGILKEGVPAVIAPQVPEVMTVVERHIAEKNIHARLVQPLSADIPLGLMGDHQRINAACAIAAARIVKDKIPSPCGGGLGRGGVAREDLHELLANARWPGRLEWIRPTILCDVAHNPAGARTLVDYIKTLPPLCKGRSAPTGPGGVEEVSCLIGIMSDKDAAGMVKVLTEVADTFYCVTPNTPRAMPAEQLAQIVRAHGKPAEITTIVEVASHWKGTGLLIVTGSFYTVGEFCK